MCHRVSGDGGSDRRYTFFRVRDARLRQAFCPLGLETSTVGGERHPNID